MITFNTFFYYWVGPLPSSVRTVKMIVGWTHPDEQNTHGDNPPTLHDVRTSGELVFKFSKMLSGRHTKLTKGISDFIVANMLRHWREIESLIQSGPSGEFIGEEIKQHPFVSNIRMTCASLIISENLLLSWVKNIRYGFITKNVISMGNEEQKEVGYDNIHVERRSFLQKIQDNIDQ